MVALFENHSLLVSSALPEMPNVVTLITHYFQNTSWAARFYEWESLCFSIFVATVVSLIFRFGIRRRELLPTGLQNFLEWIVDLMRVFVREVLGDKGDQYIPFLGTLFIYVLAMNWAGLVPFLKSPSSDLNVTVGLALCVFGLVQFLNIRHQGFLGFMYHMAGSPKGWIGWMLVPLILPIEIITQLARPLTLALRLFGNILGGELFIGIFAAYGLMMLSGMNSPVGLPLKLPFMFFELFAGLIQAMVFTLLTAVYIMLACPDEDQHGSHK